MIWFRRSAYRKGHYEGWHEGRDVGAGWAWEAGREAVYREAYLPVVGGLRARYRALVLRSEASDRRLRSHLITAKRELRDLRRDLLVAESIIADLTRKSL